MSKRVVRGIVFCGDSDREVVVEDVSYQNDLVTVEIPEPGGEMTCGISVISDIDVRFSKEYEGDTEDADEEDLFAEGKVGILDVEGAKKIRDALSKFIDMTEGRTP